MIAEVPQDPRARLAVVRLRYAVGVATAGVLLAAVFGWVALAETSGVYRWVAAAVPVIVVAALVANGRAVQRRARLDTLGRLRLTTDGIQLDAHDAESRGGSVPWSSVGGLATFTDWQRRRNGVCAVVVLPLGRSTLHVSGPRGELRSGLIVANWIRASDAESLARLAAPYLRSS